MKNAKPEPDLWSRLLEVWKGCYYWEDDSIRLTPPRSKDPQWHVQIHRFKGSGDSPDEAMNDLIDLYEGKKK
jgi:hypothetical protein